MSPTDEKYLLPWAEACYEPVADRIVIGVSAAEFVAALASMPA